MSQDATGRDDAVPSRRDSVIELVLMGLAAVPVMLSLWASVITGDGQWFQRSGALMVLFSVAVEYHRRRMAERGTLPASEPDRGTSMMPGVVVRFWRSIPYICYVAILLGTLIWAYGDLLFR